MNTSELNIARLVLGYFWFIFVCSRIKKGHPIIYDKDRMPQRKGCNPDEERQIKLYTDAVLAIIANHLGFW